jgi:hypothetical protein
MTEVWDLKLLIYGHTIPAILNSLSAGEFFPLSSRFANAVETTFLLTKIMILRICTYDLSHFISKSIHNYNEGYFIPQVSEVNATIVP